MSKWMLHYVEIIDGQRIITGTALDGERKSVRQEDLTALGHLDFDDAFSQCPGKSTLPFLKVAVSEQLRLSEDGICRGASRSGE